jgi:hypothetical protein
MTTLTSSPLTPVRVNVRLCGSVPRQEMSSLSLNSNQSAPPVMPISQDLNKRSSGLDLKNNGSSESWDSLEGSTHHTIEDTNCVAALLCSQLSSMQHHHEEEPQAMQPLQQRTSPTFEPPTWAVPATGESRLEVSMELSPYIFTSYSIRVSHTFYFPILIQPVCDSVDIQTPVDLTERSVFRVGRSPTSDVQLMHATSSRRHALLFHHSNGSCYIVDCGSAHGTYVNGVLVASPPRGGVVVPHRVRRGSMIRFGGPGAPSFMLKSFAFDLEELKVYPSRNPTVSPFAPSPGAVVQHNTRLNALGKTAKDSLMMSLSSKRSFDSIETVDSEDSCKRMRCSSPFLSPEEPLRLVSPDMNCQPSKRRSVSFSSDPPCSFYPSLVSPDISSDETEHDCLPTHHALFTRL